MDSKRIAGVAGVIGVLGALGKFLPDLLFSGLFEQGVPGWLPMVGTVGTTITLYSYLSAIFGALFLVVLSAGFGYYGCNELDLQSEYRQFFKAITAGTTLPLVGVWMVGAGAFGIGLVDGFSAALSTVIVLRLFASISLPVIFGVFGGAALDYFGDTERSPPESDEAAAGTVQFSD